MKASPTQFIAATQTRAAFAGLMLLFGVLLTACGHTVTLMPTPEGLRDERFDVFSQNPNIEKDNTVTLFYATNRLPEKNASGLRYSKKFDHTLRFGEATLQLGSEEVTWEQLHEQSTTGERRDTFEISLIRTEETGRLAESESPEMLPEHLAEFMATLNDAISASRFKTLTIYVHGANSSFYRAAAQGAQYRYFTGEQAVVLLFAWPSAENILYYDTDVKNTKQTVPDFNRLLRLMATYSSAERINIIGYSAGGRLSGTALGRLGREYQLENAELIKEKLRFGQLYFTASDEEMYAFINNVTSYIHLFDGVTVTADTEDSVLSFAKSTDGRFRLGRGPKDDRSLDLTDAQNDWITQAINSNRLNFINLGINKIEGFKFSHGAWYENPWVSTDVIATLNLGLLPEQRGLEKYKGDFNRHFWYFPPDYMERLKGSLLERRK
jgi:esterase/lipase superfamily enzyme